MFEASCERERERERIVYRQMTVRGRPKSVTRPLDAAAKARLCGDAGDPVAGSSGSISDRTDAASLAGLVHGFLESSFEDAGGDRNDAADCVPGVISSDDEDRDRASVAAVRELMNPANDRDRFRLRLAAQVSAAAEGLERCGCWAGAGVPSAALRQAMVVRLRATGYNAGICKARWETSGGLTGGSYEYIDVVATAAEAGESVKGDGERRRYIVDLDFAAEFDVARATEGYERLVAALPRVMVAREESVRQVVRVVGDAARSSLRSRGLHVPPWRKSRYILAKWFGPYRRTAGPAQAAAISASPAVGEVKSRAVGFRTTAIEICS